MEIVIDIGNSAIKIGHANSAGQITNVVRHPVSSFTPLTHLDLPAGTIVTIGRSGSHQNQTAIIDHLTKANSHIRLVDKNAKLPYASHYAPGQAGIDRLANVAAAISLSHTPAIIIDAGSAITLEVIGTNHTFLGGAIYPGIRLQAQTLGSNTADLPGVSKSITIATPIATNTVSAIHSGITHGTAGAINHLIDLAVGQLNAPSAHLIITGGDAEWIKELLPGKKFLIIPELTLTGLYLLANYQEQF